jgi:hypothetical protein
MCFTTIPDFTFYHVVLTDYTTLAMLEAVMEIQKAYFFSVEFMEDRFVKVTTFVDASSVHVAVFV